MLVAIATVVFGAALLIQGGAMLTEFAQIETTLETSGATSGGGLSALFLVGFAGIVLGLLALLGIYAPVLTAAAAIAGVYTTGIAGTAIVLTGSSLSGSMTCLMSI